MNPTFNQISVRIQAIASFCKGLSPGERRRLTSSDPSQMMQLREVHTIVDRYLLDFRDEGDASREWVDPGGPVIPLLTEPTHLEVVKTWVFIISLIARATTRDRTTLISRSANLGIAMKMSRFTPKTFEYVWDGWPERLKPESIENIVARLCSAGRRFDLTPLAYGLLFPDANDIDQVQYDVCRAFYGNVAAA